jgi:peptidoglycan/LPS O-acetylase OafA/YrhL
LDTIRFVCALWVTLGHIGLPPIFTEAEHGLLYILNGIYNGVINGPAAVIVFFVISGFCIHYPYRQGQRPHLPSYYTRRLVRIGIPLLIAIPVSGFCGVYYSSMSDSILWSLMAEIIYYLIYPALLLLAARFGWRRLILVSFVLAYCIIATNPGGNGGNYPAYGDGLNWLVGLPVWLLGCLLAQRSDTLPAANTHNIWLWRTGVVAASCLATLLRWHLPIGSIGFQWTLNLFGVVVFAWLAQEIVFFRQHQPIRWLETAGAWSYSLYLIHASGANLVYKMVPFGKPTPFVFGMLLIVSALFFSYIFFILVERPSHRLAVRLSKQFQKPSADRSSGAIVTQPVWVSSELSQANLARDLHHPTNHSSTDQGSSVIMPD